MTRKHADIDAIVRRAIAHDPQTRDDIADLIDDLRATRMDLADCLELAGRIRWRRGGNDPTLPSTLRSAGAAVGTEGDPADA